ncbi:MAG: hypothetical protein OXG25_00070 [Gammaproteobacteria bacterium]|nr:hypothetical protein [Gammaproteobacteria bacterium]
MGDLRTIDIEQLRNGVGCLDVDHCIGTCGAAQVALTEAGHPISVNCEVTDQGTPRFMVELRRAEMEPPSKKRSWRQRQRLGEWAAEGIAFLMIEAFTPFTVVDQSEVITTPGGGTGIDYYLGIKEDLDCDDEDDFPEHLGRLEVSGILASSSSSLNARVNEKIEQSKKSDDEGTPAYIIVVEFKTPVVNFTRRMPENDGKTVSQEER